jgi:hypothetical protein
MQLAQSATGPGTSIHQQHNKFLGVIHEGCLPTVHISGTTDPLTRVLLSNDTCEDIITEQQIVPT